MAEKETASLAFPMTCIFISIAFTSYLHCAWISQQYRACKRLIRRLSRKTQRQFRHWAQQLHHITDIRRVGNAQGTYHILEPSTGGRADHPALTTYSTKGHLRWDSDNTSTASSSILEDEDSDTSLIEDLSLLPSLRPTWILDSSGQYVLNRVPEPLPRAAWENELDERIRNGHGAGAWLDRMVEWVVHRIVARFDAEMRAEVEQANFDRRGMRA